MAIPVARVHLKMAHAALPALLPIPPKWKTLQLLPFPSPRVLPKPPLANSSRADADERWDAHKKAAAIPASSSLPSSGTPSSVVSSTCAISRASLAESWHVRDLLLDNGDMDTEDEEIVWKPRAMYAGPGFVAAAPEPTMPPMPTGFLVPVNT